MRILAFNITHDSSVCSVKDGKLEFFCKEERLSGVKRDKHPFKSLEKFAELNLGKVDHALYLTPSNNEPDVEIVFAAYIRKKFGVVLENYSALKHHDCHAALAFNNSNFDKALVFVIDRNGSMFFANNGNIVARESETAYVADSKNGLTTLRKNFWLNFGYENTKHEVENIIRSNYPNVDIQAVNALSIVKVYEAATTLIGQNPLENGKTMGLASYGENKKYDPLFLDNIPINEKFIHTPEKQTTCFYNNKEPIINEVDELDYQPYANRAKQVQLETQKVALNLIKQYVDKTKITNVCIVGGYGLNVVANNFYIKNLPNVKFYFEPVADDTGVPIGAAILKYKELTNNNCMPLTDNFYHYYEKEPEIGVQTNLDEICSMLVNQKSIAIFEGNPEAGPRALGHRSILFDARNIQAKKIVNKIKNREWYRPFAGIILQEYFSEYFECLDLKESPYMTINFDCKPHTKEFVPGIIHVDNTCRVQTVSSGFLYNLLTKFYNKTGCPMLLNTSFNLAGKPLVQTKQDAIDTLESSALDLICFIEADKLLKVEKSIKRKN